MTIVLGDWNVLVCPCGSEYLHQREVRVWNRLREDGDGTRTVVRGPIAAVSSKAATEIPGRRESLEVDLWCEECNLVRTLIIEQHKGSTVLRWDPA